MKASKVIFSMQLNWGINWNRNVTQNFTGGWYLTRREWAVRAPKATARPKTNLCSWSSQHCFQQTHICLLKQNFNFNSSSSKFSRLRTPWPSEILLNATSKITDLKQVLLRRATRTRFWEPPKGGEQSYLL